MQDVSFLPAIHLSGLCLQQKMELVGVSVEHDLRVARAMMRVAKGQEEADACSDAELLSYMTAGRAPWQFPASEPSAVQRKLEARSSPPRGEAIADSITERNAAALERAKENVAARAGKAAAANRAKEEAIQNTKAFQGFIAQERISSALHTSSTATANRQAHIDNVREKAAAEISKVKFVRSNAAQRAEGDKAHLEIRINDRLSAAAERKAEILAARQAAAAQSSTPVVSRSERRTGGGTPGPDRSAASCSDKLFQELETELDSIPSAPSPASQSALLGGYGIAAAACVLAVCASALYHQYVA